MITDGEPTRLIEAWTGAALAVVVDAVRAEPSHPGRDHRFVVDRPGADVARTASSHGFGLDDAIALALALDRMPGRLIVHAIEAADLTQGPGLTPFVAVAVGVVAAAILDDIGADRRLSANWPRSEPKDLHSWDLQARAPRSACCWGAKGGRRRLTLVPAPRDPRLWPLGASRLRLKRRVQRT